MNFRPSIAHIDITKLKANFAALRARTTSPVAMCPMVKANAYGHGAVRIAQGLREAGASRLGVALIEEGVELRKGGDQGEILVFGPIDTLAAQVALEHRLTPVLSEWSHLEALDTRERSELHIEFNTGMNRLGFQPEQAEKVAAWLADKKNLRLRGVCTHFFLGDDAGEPDGSTAEQLERFTQIRKAFSGFKNIEFHALNSSAIVNLSERAKKGSSIDEDADPILGARPGIALYGVEPSNEEHAKIGLQGVMTVKTKLIEVRKVSAGSAVSYGPSFRPNRESLIGVVPFGYADGYRRALSNKGEVLWHGERARVAGTVCMDYFMIDLTDAAAKTGKAPHIGDEIVLLGRQGQDSITAQELANHVGTIPYEILTGISQRVPRFYIG